MTFHLVYGGGPRAARQTDRLVQLLDLYRAARPDLLKVESLNPYTELARTEDLARRAPDLAVLRGGGVLIEYGEGTAAQFMVVSGQEMFEPLSADPSLQGSDRFESAFKGEDAITSALIRLREGRKSRVAFTTGHGEAATTDLNPGSQGIGIWKTRLGSVGCEVIELNLIKDPIPDDLTLLIIVGPRSPFKPEEVARLKAYADHGGPVLALLGNTEPSGLDDFLRSFNLEIGKRASHRSPAQLQSQCTTRIHDTQGRPGAPHHRFLAVGPGRARSQWSPNPHPGTGANRRREPTLSAGQRQSGSDRRPSDRTAILGRDRSEQPPAGSRSGDRRTGSLDRRRGGSGTITHKHGRQSQRRDWAQTKARAFLEPSSGRQHRSGDRAHEPRPCHERRELATRPAGCHRHRPQHACGPDLESGSPAPQSSRPGTDGAGHPDNRRGRHSRLRGPARVSRSAEVRSFPTSSTLPRSGRANHR